MKGARWARRAARVLLPGAIIILMIVWLTGGFQKTKVEGRKLVVQTPSATGIASVVVRSVRTPIISEATGTVVPENKITISSRIAANVVELRVRAGQTVRKGDVVARLDDRDLRSRVDQARESLRRAEATKDLAASEYRRDKPLVEQAVIPRAEFDQTEMRLRTATADEGRARETVHETEVALGYAEIVSPVNGITVDRLAEVGDLAVPGKTLASLYERGRLWLEAAVREEESPRLKLGASYRVKLDALGSEVMGRLAEIVPAADPSSRTVTARVSLPANARLYPGAFGRLLLPAGMETRLLIPEKALIRVGQLWMVDVVAGNTLARRSVQLGQITGDVVEILSGLADGERVALPAVEGAKP